MRVNFGNIRLGNVRNVRGRYGNIVCFFDVVTDAFLIKNFRVKEESGKCYFSYPGRSVNGKWFSDVDPALAEVDKIIGGLASKRRK